MLCMFKQTLSKKFFRWSVIILSLTLLTSCSVDRYSVSQSARTYLEKSAQSQGAEQQQYQLMAIEQLLIHNNLVDAEQLLQQLNQIHLDPNIEQQKIILEAKLYLKKDNPKWAIQKLRQIHNIQSLDQPTQTAYYLTAIESYERTNQLANNVVARIQLSTLPSASDQSALIWLTLQKIPVAQLQKSFDKSRTALVQGWFTLAILAQKDADNTEKLVSDLLVWKNSYASHPANQLLPSDQDLARLNQSHPLTKIALLLPLHGPYAKQGEAVRDGFITAFYSDKARPQSVNLSNKIYDTTTDDVCQLYQQALQDGAQLIVGPLTKDDVVAFSRCYQEEVPVLSLNYLPDSSNTPKHFIQFGLSPNQSAEQAADYAIQHGIAKIMLINPENDWGFAVRQSFMDRFRQLGGRIIINYNFADHIAAHNHLDEALNIDQSQSRADTLKSILQEKFKTLPRRRQDIQGIMLIANAQQGRQIHPFLDFYYAQNLPIIAISDIYDGYPNPFHDRDLEGIIFNDIPWVFDVKNPRQPMLQKQLATLSAKNFKINKRMYGLGIDSYLLATQWNRLSILPGFPLHGITGNLYVNQHNEIYRQLIWARFKHGKPVVL